MSGPDLDPAVKSILESEDARILEELKWTCLLKEVQAFAPNARLVNHVHDEFRLEGVDHADPHFRRHLDAFLAGVDVNCEEPACVVSEVHAR